MEGKVGKLKNGKAASKSEVTGEMVKGRVDMKWTGFGGCTIWPLKVVSV